MRMKTWKSNKKIRTKKRTYRKRTNIKKGGVKYGLQTAMKRQVATSAVKLGNSKSKKMQIIKNLSKDIYSGVPKLLLEKQDDKIHVYLNFLIELMGSSLYDTFIDKINDLYNLNIFLKGCTNVKNESNAYIIQNTTPAIFYGSGKDSTHFICTYDKAFDICQNKINQRMVLQSTRTSGTITTPCVNLKNCLWDPYDTIDKSCTLYAGFQKGQAHSFCQTFTLSCMLNQYLTEDKSEFALVSDFKNMRSVNGISDLVTKNNILLKNAFYAKNIACKIVRYVFNNNLSRNVGGETLDCWDLLFELMGDTYKTNPELDESNYMDFMNYFLYFCEGIPEDFNSSTFIDNVIY